LSTIICEYIMPDMETKRPRGRPPVEDGETERLNLRVSPERKERYERAAERKGLGLSAWIKAVLDRASRR
jgi:predicted HicB family RNase H-like nuclease